MRERAEDGPRRLALEFCSGRREMSNSKFGLELNCNQSFCCTSECGCLEMEKGQKWSRFCGQSPQLRVQGDFRGNLMHRVLIPFSPLLTPLQFSCQACLFFSNLTEPDSRAKVEMCIHPPARWTGHEKSGMLKNLTMSHFSGSLDGFICQTGTGISIFITKSLPFRGPAIDFPPTSINAREAAGSAT